MAVCTVQVVFCSPTQVTQFISCLPAKCNQCTESISWTKRHNKIEYYPCGPDIKKFTIMPSVISTGSTVFLT